MTKREFHVWTRGLTIIQRLRKEWEEREDEIEAERKLHEGKEEEKEKGNNVNMILRRQEKWPPETLYLDIPRSSDDNETTQWIDLSSVVPMLQQSKWKQIKKEIEKEIQTRPSMIDEEEFENKDEGI